MSGYIGTQPVPQATQTRDAFTATAGQTSFPTSGYTPEFLDVFLNGVKLAAADYTATNGSDVVLAAGATTGDILEVVSYGTFEVLNPTFDGNVTFTGNASFGDNDKAIFGDGSDLQIYHDGFNSYVDDAGQGVLAIRSNSVRLQKYTGEEMVQANADGAVILYHNNAVKFATTSTGIDVTGTAVVDGLTVEGATTSLIELRKTGSDKANIKFDTTNGLQFDNSSLSYPIKFSGSLITASTGGSERMRIDASGNVGIGTSSPDQILHVKATSNSDAEPIALFENDTGTGGDVAVRLSGGGTGQPDEVYIEFHNKSDVTNSFTIGMDDADDKLVFGYGALGTINSHDQMVLDSSGDMFLGTSSDIAPANGTNLYISDGTISRLGLEKTGVNARKFSINNGGTYLSVYDETADSERMRIDSSGNVLISTTSINPHQDGSGIALRENAGVIIGVDGTHAIIAARHNSDGEVIRIQRDNTTVGTIGVNSNDNLYFAGGTGSTKGIYFNDNGMVPADTGGSPLDNGVDLGVSNNRWKDLYLSGGVYLGGTGSANKLDDYEEGTWTPTIIGSSSAGTMTYPDRVGRYQKVGRLVTIHFYIQGNSGSGSGNLLVGGVPFTIANYHLGYGSPQWNNGITYPSGAIDANYLRNSSTTFDIRCNKSNSAFANVQYPTTPDYLRGCITYETTE